MRRSWVCGNLAFTDDGDGVIRAWDRRTFRFLWKVRRA